MDDIRSVVSRSFEAEGPYIERILTEKIEMDTGKVQVKIEFAESYYYEVISEVTGEEIHGEYELMAVMKELSAMAGRIFPDPSFPASLSIFTSPLKST